MLADSQLSFSRMPIKQDYCFFSFLLAFMQRCFRNIDFVLNIKKNLQYIINGSSIFKDFCFIFFKSKLFQCFSKKNVHNLLKILIYLNLTGLKNGIVLGSFAE